MIAKDSLKKLKHSPKKILAFFIVLLLFIFVFCLPAFASVTISVSGTRGVVTISGSASFPVDPVTGETGGGLSFYSDWNFLGGVATASSSVTYSFSYDSIKTGSGIHTFQARAMSRTAVEDTSQEVNLNNTIGLTINSPLAGASIRGIGTCSISYDFPGTTPGHQGLIGVYGGIQSYNTIGYKEVDLNDPAQTSGTYEVDFDTTGWRDGAYPIQVKVLIPRYIYKTAAVDIATDNKPAITIKSPLGIVKGVVQCDITYGFPKTKYSHGSLFVFRVRGDLKEYLKGIDIPLSPASETAGTCSFTIDTTNWLDGDYTLHAEAYVIPFVNVNYADANITVANKITEISKDKTVSQNIITVVGEPINVANGNMFTSKVDISVSSREIPLELSRTYNSQDDFKGSFGYGWRSNFDTTLTEQPDNSVIEVDETGVYTIYTKNPDGTYTPSAGKYSLLSKNSDGTFTLIRKHGKKLYFDNKGRLIKIEGRNGNTINILRASNGVISEVSDSTARKLLFTQDSNGRITQVTDPKQRTFKYEYDASGNLLKTIDPLNKETIYQYDSSHNLIRETDSLNHSLYFEYDSSDRAIHSWQEAKINEVSLSFDAVNKATTSTDSLGNSTKYEYNDYGLVTKITDSQNKTQTFNWDSSLNKTSSTNQNGFTTSLSYDSRGNLLSVIDPLSNISIFTYEPYFDFVSSVTDALGNVTQYTYDAKGNLVEVKDALNNSTGYSYDILGRLIRIKDAKNNLTNFNYDTYGNLIQTVDALNNPTSFTYDIIGNPIQTTSAKGDSTAFSYDSLNRITQIISPDNSLITYAYDAVGNLISVIDQNNNTITYAYDSVNRLILTTDALGNCTQYSYDTEGNRTTVTDANQNTTQYFYDSLNRLVKTVNPLNNQTSFNYDASGNLISKTDANGNIIYYTYDALNRLIEKGLSPQGTIPDNVVKYTYNPKGSMLSAANSNITYNFTYDALGRLIKTADSNNRILSYEYDALGNRAKLTTPEDKAVSYIYDSLNRLSSITDIYAKPTTYEYDSIGRRIKTTLPNQSVTNYTYDSLNNLLSLINKTKDTKVISSYNYQYDKVGNKLIKQEPELKTQYTYDSLYRLTQALSDKIKNKVEVKAKDKEKEKIEEKMQEIEDKTNLSELYTYDFLGNRLTSLKDTYTYNMANQLLTAKNNNYLYDANGNLILKTEIDDDGKTKTTAYSYDYENRLTSVIAGSAAAIYKYDPFGRRIAKITEVKEEVEVEKEITVYLYDNEDIILEYTTKTEDNETKEEITRYTHAPGIDEPISIQRNNQTYYYHYDGLGSVIGLTNQEGKTVESYTYDSFGNLKRHGDKVKNTFTYTGREYDKETGLYYYRNRYYDPKIGRFITQDPLGMIDGPNVYAYVNNNPVNYFDPFGLDAVVLNDSDGAFGYGHNAISIGNDQSGWDYYSQDGLNAGGGHSKHYSTYGEMVADLSSRYDRSYRITAVPEQDRKMKDYAKDNLKHPYSANPFNSKRYHCGDLVNGSLQAGAISYGKQAFGNPPNQAFGEIMKTNTGNKNCKK